MRFLGLSEAPFRFSAVSEGSVDGKCWSVCPWRHGCRERDDLLPFRGVPRWRHFLFHQWSLFQVKLKSFDYEACVVLSDSNGEGGAWLCIVRAANSTWQGWENGVDAWCWRFFLPDCFFPKGCTWTWLTAKQKLLCLMLFRASKVCVWLQARRSCRFFLCRVPSCLLREGRCRNGSSNEAD